MEFVIPSKAVSIESVNRGSLFLFIFSFTSCQCCQICQSVNRHQWHTFWMCYNVDANYTLYLWKPIKLQNLSSRSSNSRRQYIGRCTSL